MATIENEKMPVRPMPPLVVDDAVMIAHEIHGVKKTLQDLTISADISAETDNVAQDSTLQAVNNTLLTIVSGLNVLTQAVEGLNNTSEIERLDSLIKSVSDDVEKLREYADQLSSAITVNTDDISQTKTDLESISENVNTLNAQLQTLQEWTVNANEKLDDMAENVDVASDAAAAALEKSDSLETMVNDLATSKSNELVVREISTKSSVSIDGNESLFIDFDMGINGYTFIGPVGWRFGVASSCLVVNGFASPSSASAYSVHVINTSEESLAFTLTVFALYVAND